MSKQPEQTAMAKSDARPDRKTDNGRLKFVDGLRGIAVLMVTFFHFYKNSPYDETLTRILPHPLAWFFEYGWLGVYIFFLISGFVIAHAINTDRVTPRYAAIFLVRRSIRLDPPYWVTIASWITLTWVSNLMLSDRSLPYPSMPQLASHLFYLQNILGYGDIVPVFWTLCLELQFYTIFILLRALTSAGDFFAGDSIQRMFSILGKALLIAVTLASWLSVMLPVFPDSWMSSRWFLTTWFNFGLGVFLADAYSDRRKMLPALVGIGLVLVSLAHRWSVGGILTLLTATSLLAAIRWGAMSRWLSGWFIQYCGRLSYSLYLTHFVFGLRAINILYRLLGNSTAACAISTLFGFLITFATAHLMNRFVEEPSIQLAKKFRKRFA